MASRGILFEALVSARPREAVRAAAGGFPVSAVRRLVGRTPAYGGPRSRGQSLVEFALVAPVMLLLTLTALDFGRVYLGWINLQTATRAASNFAANNATAWLDPVKNADTITKYRNQVINDTKNTNCTLLPDADGDNPPKPAFTDGNGDAKTHDIGDRATVSLTCNFGVITPVISNILGNTIKVSASAMFPVKTGQFATSGGTAPVANFTGTPTATTTGTNVVFTDASTGSPTTWSWDFGDLTPTVSTQNPSHAYAAPGTYTVALTVTNASGSNTLTRTSYITVSTPPPVADFTASTTTPAVGATVIFTGTSTGTPTNWAWTFGDGGSISGSSNIASHAYNTANTYTVTLTVTAASGTTTVTKINYIVVQAPTCKVPTFTNTPSGNAQTTWNAAGFTTTVVFQHQNNLPYTIKSQSVVANSSAPCSTVITLDKN
jgi:PKD repeat protein